MKSPAYQRILLKMSGEALAGAGDSPIDPKVVDRIITEVKAIHDLGVQVGIVVGGGNFFRGAAISKLGVKRISGDYMGMLGTLMNALAMRDAFERFQIDARIHSAIPMPGVVDQFNREKAKHHMKSGRVMIFAGGTGNPLVTTDSAASLRAIEVEADVLLKCTNVDGVYDKDPAKHSDAVLYENLSFQEALDKELKVMDLTSFCQCRDQDLPIRVFNVHKDDALMRIIQGESEGTLVS